MSARMNLIGHRYGRLLAVAFAGVNHHDQSTWHCQCECGKTSIVTGRRLLEGKTKSCGCLRKQVAIIHIRLALAVDPKRRRTPTAVRDLEDAMRSWRRLYGVP